MARLDHGLLTDEEINTGSKGAALMLVLAVDLFASRGRSKCSVGTSVP